MQRKNNDSFLRIYCSVIICYNYFYVNVDARMQGKRSVREPLSLQKTYIVDGAFLKSHLHFKCSVACSGRLIIVQYKGQMKPFCVP